MLLYIKYINSCLMVDTAVKYIHSHLHRDLGAGTLTTDLRNPFLHLRLSTSGVVSSMLPACGYVYQPSYCVKVP